MTFRKTIKGLVLILGLAGLIIFIVLRSDYTNANPTWLEMQEGELPSEHFRDQKLIGIYDSAENKIANTYKKQLSMVGWFQELSEPLVGENKLVQGLDLGYYVPFITIELMGVELTEIPNGTYDEELTNFFKAVSKGERRNRLLFVRFAHEMEPWKFNWYPWQAQDPADYIAAWRYVVSMGREMAPNILWVWSPTKMSEDALPYYPGAAYVDYVSETLNNFSHEYPTFEEYYTNKGNRAMLEALNKPIIISECGYTSEDPEAQQRYLLEMLDFLENDDRMQGMVFLDEDKLPIDGEMRYYHFSNNKELMTAFIDKVESINRENDR
ncbi:MAG: glycosyl hydrolase [Lachnospiraceae bacterium]|nr:glycosyl hydrolase [Lachnospiraceae bacterium]